MTTIKLHNSKTRKKEVFEPIDPQNVRMYVCGPTVYDRAHLGNARPVLVFDILYRLLRHVYGADAVTYVRNFTDVDDKINARAARDNRSIRDITDETIAWYHDDMDALGAMRPSHEPRATEWIGAMVSMIEDLIAKGHAYAKEGHVLFRVRSYENYGALSGRSVDDMIAGARVEVAPFKEDPMDFVLWKPSDAQTPGWDSPWGYGRPGWHIECSAMSYELLGASFDIHGGGNDLQFPHHENEIAQSCCAHPEGGFANVWLHNEMLQVEGKKMSKSLGNFFTVRDLLDQGIPGEVVRLVMLGTHYGKPMDWTEKKRSEAEATLRKWFLLLANSHMDFSQPNNWLIYKTYKPAAAVIDALSNDINTAGAIAEIHKLYARGGNDLEQVEEFFASLYVMGLINEKTDLEWYAPEFVEADVSVDLSSLADKLAALRTTAMETKDFSAVDAMKNALMEAGVEVRMSKAGVELLPAAGFDAAKLEGL